MQDPLTRDDGDFPLQLRRYLHIAEQTFSEMLYKHKSPPTNCNKNLAPLCTKCVLNTCAQTLLAANGVLCTGHAVSPDWQQLPEVSQAPVFCISFLLLFLLGLSWGGIKDKPRESPLPEQQSHPTGLV